MLIHTTQLQIHCQQTRTYRHLYSLKHQSCKQQNCTSNTESCNIGCPFSVVLLISKSSSLCLQAILKLHQITVLINALFNNKLHYTKLRFSSDTGLREFTSISSCLNRAYRALLANTITLEDHHNEFLDSLYHWVAITVCAHALAVPEILCVNGDVTWNKMDNNQKLQLAYQPDFASTQTSNKRRYCTRGKDQSGVSQGATF